MNRRSPSRFLIACSCAGVTALLSPFAGAQTTIDWSPPTAGNGGSVTWATGTNWLGGVAPANDLVSDIAAFDKTSYNFQPNAGTTSIAGIQIGDGATTTGTLALAGTSLSIGADGITMFANAGTATISSPVVLGAAQTWTNNSASTFVVSGSVSNGGNLLAVAGTGSMSISGILTGAGGLTMDGAGNLVLSGSNGFSGGLTIASGTVTEAASGLANASAAFGSGTITLGAGSGSGSATLNIDNTSGAILTNSVNIAGGSSGSLAILDTLGSVTFSGNVALNNNLAVTAAGSNIVTFSGSIVGTGNITTAGIVKLSGTNAINGNLIVSSGVTTVFSSAVNASNIIYVGSSGTLGLSNASPVFAGLDDLVSGSGGVVGIIVNTAGRDFVLGGSGAYSFSGNIINGVDGATALETLQVSLTGGGVQVLSGSNSYSGGTTITSGVLDIENSYALGTNSATVSAGGTLQLQGGVNVSNSLTLSGSGVGGAGALVNVSGANTYSGSVSLLAAATISSNSGSIAITNSGTITGAGKALTLTGAGNGSISTVIGTTTAGITKTGSGTWALSGVNTYTGATVVNAGTLLVGYGGVGSLTSTVTVNVGTLGGSGSTTGAVTIGSGTTAVADAFLAPGDSLSTTGTLTTTGALNFKSDATYSFSLNSTTAQYDQIVAQGVTILSGAQFSFTDLGSVSALAQGETFAIIDNTGAGAISGTFSNLANGSTFSDNGVTYQASYGNDLVLTVVAVPEPRTVFLTTIGAALVLWRFRGRPNTNS